MRSTIEFINFNDSYLLRGRISLMLEILTPLAAPPATVSVEITKNDESKFTASLHYKDEMGTFKSTPVEKFDPLGAFMDSLEQILQEQKRREICLSDGYPSFIPSFAS